MIKHAFKSSLLLTVLILAAACSSGSRKEPLGPKPVPQFSASSLDGKTVAMKDLSNKVVIIDFWATWCSPCREEIPHLNKLYSDLKGQGLEIVGISMDDGPDIEKDVKDFARKFRMEYPVVMGNDELADQFGGVVGLPTTFIVDRKGNIVKKFVGLPPIEQLSRIVRELVG
ncbi:MAG: TlpA disulfide reductase family protein [Terriglobia bacterium]